MRRDQSSAAVSSLNLQSQPFQIEAKTKQKTGNKLLKRASESASQSQANSDQTNNK